MRHIILMSLATLALTGCVAYDYPPDRHRGPDVVYYDNDYYPDRSCSRWEFKRGLCGNPNYYRHGHCPPGHAKKGWC